MSILWKGNQDARVDAMWVRIQDPCEIYPVPRRAEHLDHLTTKMLRQDGNRFAKLRAALRLKA